MALTKKQTAKVFDMYNKDIKTTRYLLQKMEPRSPIDVVEYGDKWLEMRGAIIKKEVELTEDDYGLILDALYEQALMQENNDLQIQRKYRLKLTNDYSKRCRKVAKKFEKIFGGK